MINNRLDKLINSILNRQLLVPHKDQTLQERLWCLAVGDVGDRTRSWTLDRLRFRPNDSGHICVNAQTLVLLQNISEEKQT